MRLRRNQPPPADQPCTGNAPGMHIWTVESTTQAMQSDPETGKDTGPGLYIVYVCRDCGAKRSVVNTHKGFDGGKDVIPHGN